MNQLERLQRLRKGDNVATPFNVQILGDTPRVAQNEDIGE
jgi:hypothetical protein